VHPLSGWYLPKWIRRYDSGSVFVVPSWILLGNHRIIYLYALLRWILLWHNR